MESADPVFAARRLGAAGSAGLSALSGDKVPAVAEEEADAPLGALSPCSVAWGIAAGDIPEGASALLLAPEGILPAAGAGMLPAGLLVMKLSFIRANSMCRRGFTAAL